MRENIIRKNEYIISFSFEKPLSYERTNYTFKNTNITLLVVEMTYMGDYLITVNNGIWLCIFIRIFFETSRKSISFLVNKMVQSNDFVLT